MACVLCGQKHSKAQPCSGGTLADFVGNVGNRLGLQDLLSSVEALTEGIPAGALRFRDRSSPTYGRYRDEHHRRAYMRQYMRRRRAEQYAARDASEPDNSPERGQE